MAIYSRSSIQKILIDFPGSGKTNTLPNLINEQYDIGKTYLNERDLNKPKYEILIKKCKDIGKKH